VAAELAAALGRSPDEVLGLISQGDRTWVPLARGQEESVRQRIRDADLPGVYLEPRPLRIYPEGASTAHLLGFVSLSDDRKAYYGVEGRFNDILSGRNVNLSAAQTALQPELLPAAAQKYLPSGAQRDLILTIDRDIQAMVVEELVHGIEEFSADSGTVIVLKPKTGAILASFSWPTYEPSRFYDYARDQAYEGLLLDKAVSEPYEPGSTFKVLTMAAGLDAGVIKADDTYEDPGCVTIGKREICNSNHRAPGVVNMTEVLVQSLNVGAAYISTALGPERFYGYLTNFGIGPITEVDLQSEVPGTVRRPTDPAWSESDLATNAFGQGITVTPIQMVTAVSAIANNGLLMRPQVASQVIVDNQMLQIKPVAVQQVVSPETAKAVTDMMVATVREGVTQAVVPGYTVAGKTGTAQLVRDGRYDPNAAIASFVGFAPAYDPQFVVLVKIEKLSGEQAWGMYVAAPIFRRIAERLFVHLGIPPDSVRQAMQPSNLAAVQPQP
ncbi:MAG: penicillin-binding protein 2, partial [Chloroflexi bacterium]|nr:penicillin-binding protein 2 [Chloroflexota bacterium]